MDRVNDTQRNAAIKAVEDALAQGRIVAADRDHRVDQLRHAQTPSEVQMITQDLAHRDATPTWAPYEPPVVSGPLADRAVSAQVHQMYGARRGGAWKGLALVPILFFLVFAVVVGGVLVGLVGQVDDRGSTSVEDFDDFPGLVEPEVESAPGLFTPTGLRVLVRALRAQTGSSTVFEAGIYPRYAVASVPAGPVGKRAISYYYDGDLRESARTTSTAARFDLAEIDAAVLGRLHRMVRSLVEDPTTSYVLVHRPREGSTGWFSAHVSNAFGESGRLVAELDGTVVERRVSE